MDYGTQTQFEEIYNSIINGQRKQAAEQMVQYGFDIEELKKHYENDAADHDVDLVWKLASAAELAQTMRAIAVYSDY